MDRELTVPLPATSRTPRNGVDDQAWRSFVAKCPKGHYHSQRWSLALFDRKLAAGQLHFVCSTCQEEWTPCTRELSAVRAYLQQRHL